MPEMRALKWRTGLTLALPALLLAGCATAPPPPPPPPAVPAAQFEGMVSAADPRASAAGVAMLRAGGSAFDAAAAVLLALTVVEPQSSGIGGGGLLVYQPAGAAGPVSFDGRETAPASARPDMFMGADGKPLPSSEAVPGGRSVGVPGNIAMLALAHRQYGKLPWARLFEPAIALAEGGFEVTPRLARSIDSKKALIARFPATASLYLTADGQPRPAGSRIVNPALAASLRAIAAGGPEAFYGGPIAAGIAATVSQSPVSPAAMTTADIAGYRAKARPPVCGQYRVWRVCGMGPPSSGGVAIVQILGQLQGFDLAKLGPDSPVAWHLLAESERLAFADRAKFLADSDFVEVPVAGLIAPDYIKARASLIRADGTMAEVAAGTPAGAPRRTAGLGEEVAGTSHFSAADAAGNVAALTSTVEAGFGSGLSSGGFILNNELTDFDYNPERDGAPVANRVEPGKRPRSSMAPTIVYGPGGEVVLSVGAAGGPTIPAQVAKTIIGVLDWKLDIQQAIDLPVIMVFGDRVIIETGRHGERLAAMAPALEKLGHAKVVVTTLPYKANGIEKTAGGWRGGVDGRIAAAPVAP